MEVILLERVAKLGQMGETVRVRDGYARNFLLARGKALRATAVNRLGARLMGISSQTAGQLTFAMAALIGALSALLFLAPWQDRQMRAMDGEAASSSP